MQPGLEDDYSLSSSAKVKNHEAIPQLLHTFSPLVKHRDKLAFTLQMILLV
jgi:hypothetical protein